MGDFTLVKSSNKSTGIVAYNTSQGDILSGGSKLTIHGNVVYNNPVDPLTGMSVDINERYFVGIPHKFKKKYATRIYNFNSDSDSIAINKESYGVDDPTISFVKSRKKLKRNIKEDFDFIYCRKNGGG